MTWIKGLKIVKKITGQNTRSKNQSAQDILIEELGNLSEKKSQVEEEIKKLKREKSQFKDNIISAENIFSALKVVNKTLPKITPRQQKELLSEIIKKVVVYKHGLGVEYFGAKKSKIGNWVQAVKNPHSVCVGRRDRRAFQSNLNC